GTPHFDVDADFGLRHPEDRDVAGMGKTEVQALAVSSRVEMGFARTIGADGDVGRKDTKIKTENRPYRGVRLHIARTVRGKAQAPRPRLFLCGKRGKVVLFGREVEP